MAGAAAWLFQESKVLGAFSSSVEGPSKPGGFGTPAVDVRCQPFFAHLDANEDTLMLLDWSVVPKQFHYLNNVVLENRRDELGVARFNPDLNRHVSLVEKLTDEEIATLARVHEDICNRDDNFAIIDWLSQTSGGDDAKTDAAWRIRSLLRLLNDLAGRGIDPFASKVIVAEKPLPEAADERDRESVPDELVPFVDFVSRWGATSSDTERYRLKDEAEADECKLKELEDFQNVWTRELGKIYDDWADRESMTKNKIVAQFYFTFLLIAELDIKPRVVERVDPVAQAMEELTETGSKRKDSGRMWAARRLPNYGDDAKLAIPLLENALDDPKPNVRIWAHCALARLVGDDRKHRDAIQDIGVNCVGELDSEFERECLELDVKEAFEVLDRTPEQHNIEALRGFCITNDVERVRCLAAITEIDGLDHNGARALEYAVENGQTLAMGILLEHGADPNLRTSKGDTYLHCAATRRNNAEMIALLVKHGAEINGRDIYGSTPLDKAIEFRRSSNAEVLRGLGGKCCWRDWRHAQRACSWSIKRIFSTGQRIRNSSGDR